MSQPSSNIINFYNNKNIFLTGGTGFLGVALLEKILRTIPNHGDIYLLLRPKRGKKIEERLEEIKKNQIFEKLLSEQPNSNIDQIFSRIRAIPGDVSEENLGLSTTDRQFLIDNTNIIFHSAATLDFGDTLRDTVKINLLGTRRVAQLAKECKNLKVLIHVSSAYVNSYRIECDEIIYDLPCDPEKLIERINQVNDEELERITPELLGEHPNTYTITKHMAEHEIKKIESVVPCAIVRPSMIIGCWKEPIPGWTNSKNGPQGFLMGAAKGVIRRLPVATQLIYDYIPVDIVVNSLITAGYSAGSKSAQTVEVYHCTSSTRNPFRWAQIEDHMDTFLHDYPLKSAVWYPYLKFIPSITLYKISSFFVHIIPALLLDMVTRIGGGRPILMKLHRNVNASLDRLEKFIFTEWRFDAKHTENLHKSLSKTDQQLFNLSIIELNWMDYFRDLAIGARIYLNKEPLKTLNAAKRKDHILLIVHWIWQALVLVLIWYLFACLLGMTMYASSFIVVITYIVFLIL